MLRDKEIYIAKQSVKVVIPGKKEHGKGSGNYCFGACVTLYYMHDIFQKFICLYFLFKFVLMYMSLFKNSGSIVM